MKKYTYEFCSVCRKLQNHTDGVCSECGYKTQTFEEVIEKFTRLIKELKSKKDDKT